VAFHEGGVFWLRLPIPYIIYITPSTIDRSIALPVEYIFIYTPSSIEICYVDNMKKPHRTNPNSLKNLIHQGRPLAVGEKKKEHTVTVSQTGWEGTQAILQSSGCSSVSELLEKLGRKQLTVVDLDALELLEDQLDLKEAIQAEAEPENQGTSIPWEQVKQEAGL
jgi:hypothetical protein